MLAVMPWHVSFENLTGPVLKISACQTPRILARMFVSSKRRRIPSKPMLVDLPGTNYLPTYLWDLPRSINRYTGKAIHFVALLVQ